MASDKLQITNNKSGTPERTRRAILRNPFEEGHSLHLQIIARKRVKYLENLTNRPLKGISELILFKCV